jgi:transcription termination/antitermination protein NusG
MGIGEKMSSRTTESETQNIALQRWERSPQTSLWHVLQVKPRHEKALAQDLVTMQIDHYLPLVERVHFYGSRKFRVSLPIFPGYLFVRGSIERAFAATRTRRVVRVLRVADQGLFERDIRNIQIAMGQSAQLDPYPYLTEGVRVEVRAGPFRGLQGVVEAKSHTDRLILQVDMLGRAVSMEMDCSLLDPIS